MNRSASVTRQLDDLQRVRKEYQRKAFHKQQMAKMEKDPSDTIRQMEELRKVYFTRIVDRL
uniref:Uncharacterized protein n=1 Tax=Erinnyis ello granulovirus TaxID=307444 RepID=A0A288WIH4_9BBAC|nr:hypothetical protein EREL_019 [Erinnyis ello granulovirus]